MITMAVLAIVMALAVPSFYSGIRKSRRADAFTALTNVQQAQERHRSTNPSFTTLLTAAPTAAPPGLGQLSRTEKGYYDLSLTSVTATGYIATATAVTGTSQAGDGDCSELSVNMTGGNIRYGAGPVASINWTNPDPQRCWAR